MRDESTIKRASLRQTDTWRHRKREEKRMVRSAISHFRHKVILKGESMVVVHGCKVNVCIFDRGILLYIHI